MLILLLKNTFKASFGAFSGGEKRTRANMVVLMTAAACSWA